MKIYTKSGDEGETSLLGGKKVSKTHERIEAFGSIDELNSYIGLLASYSINNEYQQFLTKQQHILFNLGSQLAIEGKMPDYLPELKTNDITALENEIDDLTKSLPPLRHFILPGGHREVAFCHIARCVCRRAERNVVKVRHQQSLLGNRHRVLVKLARPLIVRVKYVGQVQERKPLRQHWQLHQLNLRQLRLRGMK